MTREELYKPCKYFGKIEEGLCGVYPCGCEFQRKDYNPDGTVNVVECMKHEFRECEKELLENIKEEIENCITFDANIDLTTRSLPITLVSRNEVFGIIDKYVGQKNKIELSEEK